MLDLSNSHKIVICPGYTDMRLGIIGLSGLIDKPENGCSYIFCGSKGRTIKVIEFCAGSVWIHTKKACVVNLFGLLKGQFKTYL